MGNTPKLRFEGYSGDWKRRTLGDVFIQTSNYVNPKEDGIALWSLTVEDGLTPKTERYVREFLVKKDDKFKEVRPGDIVYNPMNMTLGAVGYNGMDHSVAVSGYYTTMVAGEDYDAYFINTWLKSPRAILLYKAYATGTLLEKQRVQFPTLSIIPAIFPLRDEQADIGALFEGIDKLIALYQHKHEMLTRAKQFYLQNMFPQKGDSTPRVRFAGFSDAWEKRKLGNAFDFLSNNTLSRAELSTENGPAKNIHYGDVLTKFGGYLDAAGVPLPFIPSQQIVDKFKGSLLQDGDVIMADTAEDEAVGKCTEIAGLRGFPTISGLHTIPLRPKEKFAPGYLGYYMNSGSYHDQLLPLMQGIKVTSVSKGAIMNTDISYPADSDEQANIGKFFIRLDDLITLHQRKAAALQMMKIFLLQNMFS